VLWLYLSDTLGCSVCPEHFALCAQAVLMMASALQHISVEVLSVFLVAAVFSAP
jgi:hypothetical protein